MATPNSDPTGAQPWAPPIDDTEFERRLRTIADTASDEIRRVRSRRATLSWLERGGLLIALIAPAWNGWQFLRHALSGADVTPLGPLALLLATVLPVALLVAIVGGRALTRPVETLEGLAIVDKGCRLQDRLATAYQFLALPRRTPFMNAAIAEAAAHYGSAVATGVEWRPRIRRPSRAFYSQLAVVVVVFLVASTVPWWIGERAENEPHVATAEPQGGVSESDSATDDNDSAPEIERPVVTPKPKRDPKPSASVTAAASEASDVDDEIRKSEGQTRSGRTAPTANASGKNDSRGTPSNQGQASQQAKKQPKKKPKKSKKKRESEHKQQKLEAEKESGATAGRGLGNGSSRSPASSEWSSKDQVVSEEEEDLEDDEDVDDEFEDNDARGGVQPQLRDRKPPVNRDLTIGFGNQKNPDANGRGGAGEQKKSRGVASLVLGVPIPDHVKGRPNPGKTKVTQERVKPGVEQATPLEASARQRRSGASGWLADTDLAPWMRTLVRDYYMAIRENAARGD